MNTSISPTGAMGVTRTKGVQEPEKIEISWRMPPHWVTSEAQFPISGGAGAGADGDGAPCRRNGHR